MQLLKHVANAMQRAEGFVLERALVIEWCMYIIIEQRQTQATNIKYTLVIIKLTAFQLGQHFGSIELL